MKSEYMKTANQKSKFQDRSEAFKEVHKASKGVYIKELNTFLLTNKQKCILYGVRENVGEVKENEIINNVEQLNLKLEKDK